jgi:hypothetical protein
MIALALMLCVTHAPSAFDDAAPPLPQPASPVPASNDAAPASPAPSDAAPASPTPSDAAPAPTAPSSSPDVDITTAPQAPAPSAAPAPTTTTNTVSTPAPAASATTPATIDRSYPGVIGWTGIAISASGLVVASVAGTYAAVMSGIEGDPTSTRDDKQLAFDTHGIAGTIAFAGLGATTIGALVFAADFAAP